MFGIVGFCMLSALYKEHAIYDKEHEKKQKKRKKENREKKEREREREQRKIVRVIFVFLLFQIIKDSTIIASRMQAYLLNLVNIVFYYFRVIFVDSLKAYIEYT